MSNKAPKLHKSSKPKQKAVKTTGTKGRSLAVVLGLCTLLGGLVAILTFVPRVSMSPGDPPDPTNPFSATFTVSSSTPIAIPLYHVSARLIVGQIEAEPLPFNPPKKFSYGHGGFTRPIWQDHTLRADERFTITPEGMFGMAGRGTPDASKLAGADLAVAVTFKPWLIPWERESVFRVQTVQHGNGSITWQSVPLE